MNEALIAIEDQKRALDGGMKGSPKVDRRERGDGHDGFCRSIAHHF
jgi:hypothetical protein